jgi:NTE family protein
MPNRALVMSGGGSKGAFELGAVDYLVNERGLDFQVIAGVSTGSLNATMLAQGTGLDGLRDQLEQLKEIWYSSPRPVSTTRNLYGRRYSAGSIRISCRRLASSSASAACVWRPVTITP